MGERGREVEVGCGWSKVQAQRGYMRARATGGGRSKGVMAGGEAAVQAAAGALAAGHPSHPLSPQPLSPQPH